MTLERLLTGTQTAKDQILLGANRIDLILLSNWGEKDRIGLTGIEVLGVSEEPIEIDQDSIRCSKEAYLPNLNALLNGGNISVDVDDMWVVEFDDEESVVLTMELDSFTYIAGE